jgi:hypothetical protein
LRRFPSVHRADQERQQRVESSRFQPPRERLPIDVKRT